MEVGRAEPLLVIVGPTAVGKTDVAVRLACSVPMEVVSADSRQVYRGMDIGTGKPSEAARRAVPHHLIDIAEPHERYHAARFRQDALRAIADIRGRGRLPAVVGGTGLYVRALLKGLDPGPPADPALRRELEVLARERGPAALHAKLRERDPAAAERLHPNDRVRLIRALEVALAAGPGDAPAASQGRGRGAAPSGPSWGRSTPAFRLLMVGLHRPRPALHGRIVERVRAMVARGMIDEVRRLLAAGCTDGLPAMNGIGYRQFCAVIGGRMPEAEAVRLMIRDTGRYAKRQLTWFARDVEIRWLDVDAVGGLAAAAERIRDLLATERLLE
ncbi:MAG: tRNA (adenosine(37)-N6)-dimethylallyltransferase MiaA [Candidatus Rokubacteria bacterium]|nr:tRNA (adenosine(37)-N6)-dimethylallyltransferase MiaA [Candidatus Rokubacteria bacterium]